MCPPFAQANSYFKVGGMKISFLTLKMSNGVGFPPGLDDDCGDAGEEAVCFQTMAKTMRRLAEIRNVEVDSISVEKHLKELAMVTRDHTKCCGRMFEQEHLRFIAMFSATRASGGGRGGRGFRRGVMQNKVSTNLRAVNGDRSLFR